MHKPIQWYVVATSSDGAQRAELVGPFKRKADADAELELVSEQMHELHPNQAASALFTIEPGERLHAVDCRAGTKNRLLGYRTCMHGWIVA